MAYVIEDFVNRTEQLATLWKIVRQEMDQRMVLVRGPDGIGKTYLLEEFRAECEGKGIDCAWFDFAESSDHSYMALVLAVFNQLGPEGFEGLTQAIAESRTLGAWETVPTSAVSVRAERPVAMAAPPGGRGGGVDFYGPTTIHGDVVGRDAYYVTQIVQRDDPMVQQTIQARVTAAFRDCLVELTTARPALFLLNSWERATTDIREWLSHNLLNWILHKQLPNAVVLVAGQELPDLRRPPRRIGRWTLSGLPEDAVQTYWVEICGLPPEDVPNIIMYSGGLPMLIALMADQRAMAMGLTG